ncbi:BRO-N domain-containing protein [Thiomonas sp.]
MSTEVMEFDFGGKTFKATIDKDGQAWFVASEVCEILEISKYRDAVARLDEDERMPLVVDTLGGAQRVASISESGLYSLVMTSRKPDAKKFKKWVTSEVLPAIRKTGRYNSEKAAPTLGPIEAPSTQERLQGAMNAAGTLIGIGEAALGEAGLRSHIPKLSHAEIALGLAGMILKGKQFLLTMEDIERPVVRALGSKEVLVNVDGHVWIDKLLSVMNREQLKIMASRAITRIV